MRDASRTPDPELTAEERELGIDLDITRRDFLNTVALGTGAALLGTAAPGLASKAVAQPTPVPAPPWHPFTGYSGIGGAPKSKGCVAAGRSKIKWSGGISSGVQIHITRTRAASSHVAKRRVAIGILRDHEAGNGVAHVFCICLRHL